jgi:hypothetical protein
VSASVLESIPAEQIERLPAVDVTCEEYERLWRADMATCVKSINLDFLKHTATVMTAGGCVDMTGCIAAIMMLDPDVRNIQTIDGNAFGGKQHCTKDAQYVKDPERGWFSLSWDRPMPMRSEFYGTAFATRALQSMLLAALRGTRKLLAREEVAQ